MLAIVQIHVLGPLRVDNGGAPCELGGPKQRAVLAILVAEAGRPVPTDALIMSVYGPDAAPGTRRSLQTYISSLRASLGNVIHHHNQAYTLDVDPGSIDSVQFETTIDRARETTDDSVAAHMLRDALRMWRGTPYADIEASAALRTEIMRLEEIHTEALETRIELDLVAGHHRDLLAELSDLTATYPTREGLRAHQMLALYRCGRQADALRAYRQAQAFLHDHLGLDPSTGLQTLESRILEQDPALDYRPMPSLRPAPARYTKLIGRSHEIEEVRDLLEEHRLVTITGTGGIGKSGLAAEVTRSLSESMATAFVPIDTQSQKDIVTLILEAVGIDAAGDADRVGAIAAVLSMKPTILLLDGCERIIDEIPGPISEILSRSASTHILVTSREGLFIAGEHRFLLGPLGHGEDSASNQLFEERAGISHGELDARSLAMVSDIGIQLSGIPLALELAAAQNRTVPLDAIVEQLDRQVDLLSRERGPRQRHLSMTGALDWSYDLLDPLTQRAFRQLAVFRGGISSEAAAAILDTDDPTDQLGALADVSLLVPPDNDIGFRMLEPVRQYAWRHLEQSGELDASLRRHADWIVELCKSIRHEFQTGNSSEALAKLRTHGAEIEATARWALDSDRPEITMAIVANVGRRWQVMFDPRRLREMGGHAIAHPDAPTGDLLVRTLAHIAWMSRETDRDTALEIAGRLRSMVQETNDADTLFDVTCSLAIVPRDMHAHASLDEMVNRLGLWDEVIEWSTELGWPSEPQFYNRAVLLQDLGRYDEAEAVLRDLLLWADESRPLERGRTLHALARLETTRGSFDTAIDMATEAAQLLVDAGDLDFAAEAQYGRAHALHLLNRPDEALRALDVINQLHELIGLPPAADEDPALVAAIFAGADDWDAFRASMATWIEHSPPADNEATWEMLLVGDASLPSHLGLLMYPTARWLAVTGRAHAAAQIVATAPMAFDAMEFDGWEEIGEAERFRNLSIELEGTLIEEPLPTVKDLYLFIVSCIRDSSRATKHSMPR